VCNPLLNRVTRLTEAAELAKRMPKKASSSKRSIFLKGGRITRNAYIVEALCSLGIAQLSATAVGK